MNIDVDFQTFKRLTTLRQSEHDSYSDVINRLLVGNAEGSSETGSSESEPAQDLNKAGIFGGVSFKGVQFPDGTQLQATHKGAHYTAEIKDGRWIDHHGQTRTSPSEAAIAITGYSVNGWTFWQARTPESKRWRTLKNFRQ